MPKKKDEQDKLAEHFETGQWKGLPRWQCRLCRFDTLESEERIREHLVKVHFPPPVVRREPLPLVDRFGNQIIKEVVEDG